MTSEQLPPHSEKPAGFHDKPMSFWQRIPHRSDTGGVSPMYLEGRERFMTERMRGMTPERRAWRKQWLQDQVLSHREPVEVPQLYKELNNPFKRFYNYPFEKLQKYLEPKMGLHFAQLIRSCVKMGLLCIPGVYYVTYLAMYWQHDWTHRMHGVGVMSTKPVVFPNDPSYPFTSSKKFDDYYSFGFKKSTLYKTPEQIKAEAEK